MKQAEYTCIKESTRDVIIAVYEGETLCPSITQQLGYDLEPILDRSFLSVTTVHTLGKFAFARMIFLGMGPRSKMTTKRMRKAFAEVSKYGKAPMSMIAKTAVCDDIDLHKVAELFAETYELAIYREAKIGSESEVKYDADIVADEDVSTDIKQGGIYAQGINHARDWANMPANIMTPQQLAEEAQVLAERYSLECTILNQNDLVKLKAGGLLAVAQGSDQKPCMIVLSYQGAGKQEPYTVLIGKGLTFDAGGYHLKSDNFDMKYDMCGAADVLGAMEIIAASHFSRNVAVVIPASENLINGSAYKGGDVITTMSGKTVEIVNTDAEGRMILCDAITYAQTHIDHVERIVDIATLTGACARALGDVYTGVFATHEEFYRDFVSALTESDENGWRLPLGQEYHDVLKSDSADLINSAKGSAGASVAACFLEEFIAEGIAWIHLDIAGVAYSKEQGANGVMVRTLANLCR